MKIVKLKHAPGLPFPTRRMKVVGGFAEEYLIPDDKRAEVLRKLYPFVPIPSLDTVMVDIHEDKKFKVRQFRVLRGADMDWLVSPYFPVSGGTVIDWWDPKGD